VSGAALCGQESGGLSKGATSTGEDLLEKTIKEPGLSGRAKANMIWKRSLEGRNRLKPDRGDGPWKKRKIDREGTPCPRG